MLKRDHCKIILFPFAAWVFFVSLFLVAPAMPVAGEKTPPFYPEGPPLSPSTGSKHYSKPPDKDFSWLFRESSAHEKTPPYYPEKPGKQSASVHRGETATLTESGPGIDANRVRTEEYVVQEGDWLVKILREKGLLNEQNLPRLLSLLRELNSSLQSLDMIQPGEKIVILVKVVPGNETEKQKPARELKRDTYRVKRGDILSQVVMRRYDVSRQQFNREYLKLFAACNPSVEDPNKLLAGQTINLPHYPPVYLDDAQPKEAPLLRDLEKSRHHIALKAPTILESRGRRVPIQPSPAPERPATPPKPPQTRPKPAAKDMPLPTTVKGEPPQNGDGAPLKNNAAKAERNNNPFGYRERFHGHHRRWNRHGGFRNRRTVDSFGRTFHTHDVGGAHQPERGILSDYSPPPGGDRYCGYAAGPAPDNGQCHRIELGQLPGGSSLSP